MNKRFVRTIVIGLGVVILALINRHHLVGAINQPVHAQVVAQSPLETQILAAERQGLDALKTGDLGHFADLTADEAILVDAQGPASKAQVMKNVAGFTLAEYTMEAVKFVAVSADSGLISYKITEKGSSHGHEFTAQAYVSSLWTRRGDRWLCLFSQETAVPKPAHPAA